MKQKKIDAKDLQKAYDMLSPDKAVVLKTDSIDKVLDRVIEVQAALDGIKKLYAEMDLLTDQLLKAEFKAKIHNGKAISIVDNFKDKNSAFRTTSIKRFEIKID